MGKQDSDKQPGQADNVPTVESASPAQKFFLLKPTFGLLLLVLFTLGGLMAYQSLVKESLPDLDIPQATISTFWPGADPQTIEQEVTEPIEKEIKTIQGLKSVTSASFDSYSIIAVEFQADAEMDESMQLLRAKLNDAEGQLPMEVDTPKINQVSVDDRPILTVVLYGDVDERSMSRVARNLEDRLEQVQGVNEVDISGMRNDVIEIQLIPDRVLGLGISPVQVSSAIQSANLDMPWGEIESETIGATVRLQGRFRDLDNLRQLPIRRNVDGRLVRLSEIAEVRRNLEREKTRAFFSWQDEDFAPGVEISIKKVPGSDTIAVIDRSLAALEEAQQSQDWIPAVKFRVTQDESESIMDSLSGVLNNAWQAMLAVFVILFVLLSWREGLIAGLCVPLTFLAALIMIWVLGYSLNELVIIGMVLALGLLVDVFILMMEGLHDGIFVQHLSFGQAAMATVQRYAIPAAAGQATTILALAPLMAIGGTAGKFIRVLPAAAIICLIAAFLVALLVAVPLSRYLLGRISNRSERATPVDRITAVLSERFRLWSMSYTLRSKLVATGWSLLALGIFIVSLMAFSNVTVVMYPKGDGKKLGINIELPPNTRLDSTQLVADRIGDILHDKNYFESVVKLVGKKSPFASSSLSDALTPSTAENYLGFSAMFVEREEREHPGYVIADELREEIAQVLAQGYAGATLTVVPETGQPSSAAPVEIGLSGKDMDTLLAISRQVQAALNLVPGAFEVHDNLGNLQTEINLKPRREAIDFHGITEQDLAMQIRYAMTSGEIGKFAIGGMEDDLPIQLSMAWPSRQGSVGGPTRLDELAMVRAFAPDGSTVPLLSLLEPGMDLAPLSITHNDARRSISVLAQTGDTPPQQVIDQFLPQLEAMQADWPAGYSFKVGGEVQETAETFASAGIMLVVAVILVFGLLVLLFGSFSQSLIVIITMPLALIGTFLGFFLLDLPFSFFAMVGLISLIGIVVNNAIVMVDTMNSHLRSGLDVRTSAARGASDRLRPIIGTSLTTIVGLIPLAVSNPMWQPLCFAIIFGLLASTVISLVVVPCLYFLLTKEGSAGVEDLN